MTKEIQGRFKKGVSGNPSGRPKALIPELRGIIERNREAAKALIIQKVEPRLEEWLETCVQTGIEDGDVVKLKMLLELALGRMVEEQPEFPLSEEEKELVLAWRKRKALTINEP